MAHLHPHRNPTSRQSEPSPPPTSPLIEGKAQRKLGRRGIKLRRHQGPRSYWRGCVASRAFGGVPAPAHDFFSGNLKSGPFHHAFVPWVRSESHKWHHDAIRLWRSVGGGFGGSLPALRLCAVCVRSRVCLRVNGTEVQCANARLARGFVPVGSAMLQSGVSRE